MFSRFRCLPVVCFFLIGVSGSVFGAKTLVVILGQPRAHELTFDNIKKNLIDELDADLAVCIGQGSEDYSTNPFYQQAKYRFTYPEPFEYSQALDAAYAEITREKGLSQASMPWRTFLNIPGNFVGGVLQENKEVRPGSGAVLLFLRWFLLQNILDYQLLDKYDFFVITRSDYIYTLPHPPVDLFADNLMYVPDGEHAGGITDRHAVIPKSLVVQYLDILPQMVIQGKGYYEKNKHNRDLNLETFIFFHLNEHHLSSQIRYFPYVMYAVKGSKDPTRWSQGVFSPEHGYFLKYPAEYSTAMSYLKEFQEFGYRDLNLFYQERIK